MQKKTIIVILSTILALFTSITDAASTYNSIEAFEVPCNEEEQSEVPSEPEILPFYEDDRPTDKLY